MPTQPTAEQLTLLAEIHAVFAKDGSWPIHLYLDTELERRHGLVLDDILPTIPDGLLRVYTPIREDRPIMLRIAGMQFCDSADDDIARFIRALRWCVAKRAAFQLSTPTAVEQLRPSTDEATADWAKEGQVTTPLDLTKLHAMIEAEQIDVSLNGSPGDWSWDIQKNIRRFKNVRDVDDYLQIVNAQQAVPANPMLAPSPTIVVQPTSRVRVVGGEGGHGSDGGAHLTVEMLHPLVRRACAQLFAGEHYRQGVLDAALALRDLVRDKSGLTDTNDSTLYGKAFGGESPAIVVAPRTDDQGRNLQQGTLNLALGIAMRLRNVLTHESVELDAGEAMEMAATISRVVRDVDDADTPPPNVAG